MSPGAHTPRDRRRDGVLLLVALLVAGGFWLVFWRQSADSALVRVPILDEAWYLREAARLRAEGGPGDTASFMSPGYPLLVALAGGRAPDDAGVLEHASALLVGLQAAAWLGCALLVAATVRGVGRRAGFTDRAATTVAAIAALLFLGYRPAAIFARTVLLEVPLTLLVTGTLAALGGEPRRPVARAILAGLLLGLAAALRAHVLVLLPVAAVVLARGTGARRRRAAALAAFLVLALLPVSLAAWHNTRVTGRLAGPTLNAGVNLYLGQLRDAHGLFTTLAGADLERDPSGERYLEERLGRALDGPADADRAWQREVWRLVAADPGRAAAGWLAKVWLHLQGWEIAQVTPLGLWPAEAPVLRLLVVPWALLVVAAGLALVAVASVRPSGGPRAQPAPAPAPLRAAARLWAGGAILLIAVQSLFFVVSRYRLVLAPALAVAVGLGLLAGLASWRARDRRLGLRLAIALPFVVLVVVPWGLAQTRREWSALESYNLARRLIVLADRTAVPLVARERVESLLARTCEAVPGREQPWRLRALNLAALGRTDAAQAVLTQGAMQVADPRPLEWTRIALLREQGRLDTAEALMTAYLRDWPDDPDMLHDLAVLQGARGRWAAAAATARRLMAAAPDDHRGWLDLGVALANQGQGAEAAGVFREGLARFPADPARAALAANLARLAADGS